MAPVNVNDSTVFRDGAGVCVAEGGGGRFLTLNVVINTLKQWMRMKGHFLMRQVAFQSLISSELFKGN